MERLQALFSAAFRRAGAQMDAAQVGEIAETVQRTLEPFAPVEQVEPETEEKGGAGSGHWSHAGRQGQRGGSAVRGSGSAQRGPHGVQAGITSHKEGKPIEQVRTEMRQFTAKLKALPGVRNVSVQEGRGGWKGGSEPTWVTHYEGNGDALALLAATGKRFDQDGVLVMRFVDKGHPNAQPLDQIGFNKNLGSREMGAIERVLVSQGVKAWTWSRDTQGRSRLQVACVPQWDGDAHAQTRAMEGTVKKLSNAGITVRSSRAYIDPLVMDASNYDDFIQQGR